MFTDFNNYNGGRGEPQEFLNYFVAYFGAMDFPKLLYSLIGKPEMSLDKLLWHELHTRIEQEYVDSFDPMTHPIPNNCANIMAFAIDHFNQPELIGFYSIGVCISAETARAIVELQVPDVRDTQMKHFLSDYYTYILGPNNGVSIVSPATISVVDRKSKIPSEVYIHPRLRRG